MGVGRGDVWAADSLAGHAADLGRLRGLLAPGADVDLYACVVAQKDAGRTFVDSLAATLGATVQASDDAVGTIDGADLAWEYATGPGRDPGPVTCSPPTGCRPAAPSAGNRPRRAAWRA